MTGNRLRVWDVATGKEFDPDLPDTPSSAPR